MKKPILVVLAAGMGSRYGGLKQIDPVDPQGHSIMDFSIYDAHRAGFDKVVFIIKKENEAVFREAVGNRVAQVMDVHYAFQDIEELPAGYSVPEGRTKPWGTAHAILCARAEIDGAPFAVINADDYYGSRAFELIYTFLNSSEESTDVQRYAMVGYHVGNTVTDNGYVSRGVCKTDANQMLVSVTERTHIEKRGNAIAYTEDGGTTWIELPEKTLVSMNLWGFTSAFVDAIDAGFPAFLDQALETNPLKGEYFLPSVVSHMIENGRASVKVLSTPDKWFGVTYKEDKPVVVDAIKAMKRQGVYPEELWGKQ
ncbi:MAG: sugar phosphate nucleotidyltransferase [Actinomycetaceae bacterium]|nr:hypothetical protein [Arcanobacterium sp.]MDD7505821.1 sugar phosphate nucleotidyltransferase [Actinomycetaceae bacterium]MDY6142868.1 sugar phosphate nucleotidyltransferase [Arcanobacterium sp.]